jgi:hypothetical protein
MSASLPIILDGAVIGIASPVAGRLRFRAADPRLAELQDEIFDTVAAAGSIARAVLAERALTRERSIAPGLAPGLALGGAAASRLLRAVLQQPG